MVFQLAAMGIETAELHEEYLPIEPTQAAHTVGSQVNHIGYRAELGNETAFDVAGETKLTVSGF
jgi:hypothetical protein